MKDFDQEIRDIVVALGIPKEAEGPMLDSIYENLKDRVGMHLSIVLSDEDIERVQPIINSVDDSKLFSEISQVIPNFDEIVEEEIEVIREDLGISSGS